MNVCPECAHEWARIAVEETVDAAKAVRDAVGNPLADGDTVTVIQDLKVKGSSSVVRSAPGSRTFAWSTAPMTSTAAWTESGRRD